MVGFKMKSMNPDKFERMNNKEIPICESAMSVVFLSQSGEYVSPSTFSLSPC
ncbi:unnamed protein product, partial [Ixodes persulcatus]